VGKRYSVNKEIARNRKFHGIGQEVEKSHKKRSILTTSGGWAGEISLNIVEQ
jgi:hypothetical protein